MVSQTMVADGSAQVDAPDSVEVDRDEEPYRWACPQGHTSWERTNSHGWCAECSRAAENGADVDPEHWELLDKQTDETIPYSAVVFVEQ